MSTRGINKTRIGHVISDKMDKTVVVQITRRVKHPLYKKYYNKRSKFYAHDESSNAKIGDLVRIIGMRPKSKLKRWKVVEVIRKGLTSEVSEVV